MTDLHIADGLALPIEAVTETFAILAKRGKGKTNTAVVMAEEMIGAGQPVVIVDPVGVWWGIRSAADGQAEGLPVVIFGGDHADVPLTEKAGEVVADVIIDQRLSAVLDLSTVSKSAARRFMADFTERLYHRNRDPLHVIIDEADSYAPQRTAPEGARLLGAMGDLVRRGRARGVGVTLITQRPAAINKDVLTQAEVLIALGMTGPRDIAAIDEWVSQHGDPDQAREVKATLAGLDVGEAWVWSPSWLDILQRVKIRPRWTFDSSRTPKVGEKRVVPQKMAPVDLVALGEQIEATVEQATADDPKALRKRLADLQRELAAAAAKVQPPKIERVEVPVLGEDAIEALQRIGEEFERMARDIATEMAKVADIVRPLRDAATMRLDQKVTERLSQVRPLQHHTTPGHVHEPPMVRPARPEPISLPSRPDAAGMTLGKVHRAILSVLVQRGGSDSVSNVALLAGYSSKGGGFRNGLSSLRTAGYIEGSDPLTITDAGVTAVGHVDPLPTGGALREHWKGHTALGKAHGLILDALAQSYPQTVTVDWLGAQTGYEPTGGGFRNAVSRLRSLGLISGNSLNLLIDPTLADW